MKRAIVIVLDGVGAGEAPDSAEFGDADHPSTLKHVWDHVGGVNAPTLQGLGMFAAGGINAEPRLEGWSTRFGRLRELSQGGKDSVTGHWEMMGVVASERFATYPEGFPSELVQSFEARIGTRTLGNKAASGTAVIAELGEEHMKSGHPILYTSADSVFQVAAHEKIIQIERLYEICEIGRELSDVQRVIARPFIGDPVSGFTRTERRRDFPLAPPDNLVDLVATKLGPVYGVGVVPELFAGRGFKSVKRTQSNSEHEGAMHTALDSDAAFIFANFEDFDMLYGHRNDPVGFAKCLEEFDETLNGILDRLKDDDLLIITADHGNDPTSASTDHSREYVPVVVCQRASVGSATNLGDTDGMAAVGATVARHLGLEWAHGIALI
ncbi:MAG: phosphopentomutase [Fimbriimonadaceae bacterium]